VAVEADGAGLKLGKPQALFSVILREGVHETPFFPYAVSGDGQRFLVARPSSEVNKSSGTSLTVALNWDAALR
jgi:hypothetical protein